MLERSLIAAIESDLQEKMVLLAGPRQVGKTTLARQVLERAGAGTYFSWDNREDRKTVRHARWPAPPALVVLDELHKMRGFKRWLKGEYDKHHPGLRFLVTGSARLDVYRRGGDSLQGRYHHYRLHPLTLAELEGEAPPPTPGAPVDIGRPAPQQTLESLVHLGGFPEPFLAGSERTLRRWHKERLDRFLREDVRDLETVRDLSALDTLSDLLVERVASPLSLNALREDLEVSHRAVAHWFDVFEYLYYLFRVRPYSSRQVRGLKKMPKAYLWDWSLVEQPGPRFENLVASHLLKFCHLLADRDGHTVSLRYLRDVTGREVDFLVLHGQRPWFAVEAKLAPEGPARNLRYFRDRLRIPHAYQISLESGPDFAADGIRCLPAARFLAALA